MPLNKRVLKLTNTEAILKFDGGVDTYTIDLQTDLLGANEVLDGTQAVNITMMVVSGAPTGVVTITRNSVILYHLSVDACAVIDMQALGPVSDNTLNTYDIVVANTVAAAEVIIKLRKVAGYKTKIQPETYGVYDDPTSATA